MPEEPAPPQASEHGLKANAIGFVDALVIGLASTAPAYSLAAVIGIVVVIAGVQAPAVLLASFVPMFFIAAAFYYMNRADQDCGTTFSWVTRALGPWPGWMGGWAICTTGILVVGSLADVAARYFYVLIGADGAADSKAAVTVLAVGDHRADDADLRAGHRSSARLQNVLIGAQVGALLLFAVVALWKVAAGDAPEGSIDPALSWLNPLEIESTSVLVAGLLTGVFIYWGWESAVNLTEEVEDSATAPGKAAVLSTLILLVTYVSVAIAVVAFAGLGRIGEFEDDDAIFSSLARRRARLPARPAHRARRADVRPGLDADDDPARLAHDAVDGAREGDAGRARPHPPALPDARRVDLGDRGARRDLVRGRQHAVGELPVRHALRAVADDRLLLRAQRHRVRRLLPPRAAALRQEPPLHRRRAVAGAVILTYLLVKSVIDLADPEASYSGSAVLGIGVPLFIGVAFIGLGLILMIVWWLAGPKRLLRPQAVRGGAAEVARGPAVLPTLQEGG